MPLPSVQGAGPMGLGDLLGQQVKDETDEERKKRLLEQQRMSGINPVSTALGMSKAGAMSSVYGGAY